MKHLTCNCSRICSFSIVCVSTSLCSFVFDVLYNDWYWWLQDINTNAQQLYFYWGIFLQLIPELKRRTKCFSYQNSDTDLIDSVFRRISTWYLKQREKSWDLRLLVYCCYLLSQSWRGKSSIKNRNLWFQNYVRFITTNYANKGW